MVFRIATLFLWKRRNNYIFNGEAEGAVGVVHSVLRQARNISNVWVKFPLHAEDSGCELDEIKQLKPKAEVVKLNVDITGSNDSNLFYRGGLFRDSKGTWIKGFNINLGRTSILEADLRAIFEGITLVTRLEIKRLVIESDCREAV